MRWWDGSRPERTYVDENIIKAIYRYYYMSVLQIVKALGYEPIWFCTAMLLNVELAQITPPFGILLYVVRGIVPNTSMAEITRAAVPIIVINLLVMVLLIAIPSLSLWLPSYMTR